MKKKMQATCILLCMILLFTLLVAGCSQEAATTTEATAPSETVGLLRENWNISFEVEDVSATGLTLVYTQRSGGQQLGDLLVESYMLYSYETAKLITNREGVSGNPIQGENGAIIMECDATQRVALDWSEAIGSLPAGNYYIYIDVLDMVDRDVVQPPEGKQFLQGHAVEFTIP